MTLLHKPKPYGYSLSKPTLPEVKTTIRTAHSTAHFRIANGEPEMILENGSDCPCFVTGADALKAIAFNISQALRYHRRTTLHHESLQTACMAIARKNT